MHFSLAIFIVCVTLHNAFGADEVLLRAADNSLMQFMLRSSSFSNQNPQRSMNCFDHYVPLLNKITAAYEQGYAFCLDQEESAKRKTDSQFEADRKVLEASAQDACGSFSNCLNNNTLSYLDCFSAQTALNSKLMYSLSNNASDMVVEVREHYRTIENDKYRCTNATERTYLTNSAATYEEMQRCLQGQIAVPTTTTTTTPTPTTTTTTNTPIPQPTTPAATATTSEALPTTSKPSNPKKLISLKLEDDQ